MEWADEVHRGVPGRPSRTAAIFKYVMNSKNQYDGKFFRSDDPKERVWGVAFEISRDFWDRVLEEKVESHLNGFLYNCRIGWLQRKGWIQHC